MNENRTPKERFDEEMKQMNKDIAENNPNIDQETDAIMEQLEDEEIDKSMGDVKEPIAQQSNDEMTDEQFQNLKEKKEIGNVLKEMSKTSTLGRSEKLSVKQVETMQKLLKLFQKNLIDDPVLKHLLEKKIELAQQKAVLLVKSKDIQLRIFNEMKAITEEVSKVIGGVHTYNMDILKYVQKNPKILEDGKESSN